MKHNSYQKKSPIKLTTLLSIIVAMIFAIAPVALNAQDHGNKSSGHIMVKPEDVKWMDGPPSIPPGAKFAVIEGDPKIAGLFTMRLWFPADYKIGAHWHPADEHITVISGTFLMGLGDKFDDGKLHPLSTGSFAVMATGTRHFAATTKETVVQLHGMGPWGINYVNPSDDPRKK